MPEQLATQLARLVPDVDIAASREIFERARHASPGPPRWLLPAAVIALVAATVVGLWALARDDGAVTPGGAPATAFEVLVVRHSTQPSPIVIATDDATLRSHLDLSDGEPAGFDVDFDRSIVAMFSRLGSGCAVAVADVEVHGNVWTPRFETRLNSDSGVCNLMAIPWVSVVAFDRDALRSTALDGEVVFRLDPTPEGEAGAEVAIQVGEAVTEPPAMCPVGVGPIPALPEDHTPNGSRFTSVPEPPIKSYGTSLDEGTEAALAALISGGLEGAGLRNVYSEWEAGSVLQYFEADLDEYSTRPTFFAGDGLIITTTAGDVGFAGSLLESFLAEQCRSASATTTGRSCGRTR